MSSFEKQQTINKAKAESQAQQNKLKNLCTAILDANSFEKLIGIARAQNLGGKKLDLKKIETMLKEKVGQPIAESQEALANEIMNEEEFITYKKDREDYDNSRYDKRTILDGKLAEEIRNKILGTKDWLENTKLAENFITLVKNVILNNNLGEVLNSDKQRRQIFIEKVYDKAQREGLETITEGSLNEIIENILDKKIAA